jgi:hypothetical protein
MTNKGWTNYATWCVWYQCLKDWDNGRTSAEQCECYVSELLDTCEDTSDQYDRHNFRTLPRSYANAFLSDVNWSEIARRINDDNSMEATLYVDT